MAKEWKRVTVCMTEAEYLKLKVSAGVRSQSIAAFMRDLIAQHIAKQGYVTEFIESMTPKTAKPS